MWCRSAPDGGLMAAGAPNPPSRTAFRKGPRNLASLLHYCATADGTLTPPDRLRLQIGFPVQLFAVAQEHSRQSLPEFANPPVTEVALSAAYDPLPQYTSAHAGLFWTRVADRFSHAQEQPPLLITATTE